MSHDSGFRRKNHDRSKAHQQRGHRDQASRAFEDRMRQQQEARERMAQEAEDRRDTEDPEEDATSE